MTFALAAYRRSMETIGTVNQKSCCNRLRGSSALSITAPDSLKKLSFRCPRRLYGGIRLDLRVVAERVGHEALDPCGDWVLQMHDARSFQKLHASANMMTSI
jgi:hypothetical protein